MKLSLHWNELLLEIGKVDPLSLWRVGDRMNDELLKPFTTVVTSRPARYFSMYCWIFHSLTDQNITDQKKYWKRFFEMEAVFLCAIQLHTGHSYDNFSGQIGSEHAKELIAAARTRRVDLKAVKLRNGWEVNYKNAMFIFNLIETDFGSPINMKLTEAGQRLAKGYGRSINSTKYLTGKHYLRAEIPLKVIEKLSDVSCPCLSYVDTNDKIHEEKKIIIDNMLLRSLPSETQSSNVLHASIFLMLHCMKALNKNGINFNRDVWHNILSNKTYFYGTSYFDYLPPKKYLNAFQFWQMYNLELLFVYALEKGLSGFLNLLQSTGDATETQLNKAITDIFDKGVKEVDSDPLLKKISSDCGIQSLIENLLSASDHTLSKFESDIINKVKITNSSSLLFYAYLLYIYIQSKYDAVANKVDYALAHKYYLRHSQQDGYELSLTHSSFLIGAKSVKQFFQEVFVREWIINRQMNTRIKRNKHMAWFSRNDERKTYNFEAAYDPTIYRASRIGILMAFLQNIGIVDSVNGSWSITPQGKTLAQCQL